MYTEKVDIWSLACVFYEVLSGLPLFDGIIMLSYEDKLMSK